MFAFPLLFGVAVASVQVSPFIDTAGSPYADEIAVLQEQGIVRGYGGGVFRPDATVNRAEFLSMLLLAVHGKVPPISEKRCFADFRGTLQWFWPPACVAKTFSIIDGYPDGTFRGDRPVVVAEALKMIAMAWNFPLPQYFRAPDHWYDPYFTAVAATGIGDFSRNDPEHLLTRGEAAWLLVSAGEPLATVEPEASSSSVSSSLSSGTVECGNGIAEMGEQCDDGNREDGDGCSSICIIVPETVQHSVLRIDQRPQGSALLAGGTKNLVLLSFDAQARWQDAILTGLKFRAASGSLLAASNYRLYVDTNGDGEPDAPVATGVLRGGTVSFSAIATRIATGAKERFEVRGDLAETSASVTLALGFLTSDPQYVEAVGAMDGRQLTGIRTDGSRCIGYANCWIAVFTQTLPAITVGERGNLFVTASSQPVRSHQLLAGGASDDLLRLTFHATAEDVRVTHFTIDGATADVSSLGLYEPGATDPFAVATSVQCHAVVVGQLCAETNFVVHRDIVRDVRVRAVLKPDTDGARSGNTVALSLASSTTGADKAVEALGISSQKDLAQNDGDAIADGEVFIGRDSVGPNIAIVGPVSDVVVAKIVEITNGDTRLDRSFVPSGREPIGIFRFRAAPHHNSFGSLKMVAIESITFTVVATNVRFATGSFVLTNASNVGAAAPCTESATMGGITVVCANLGDSGVSTFVEQGSSTLLALRAFIESPKVSSTGPSTLQVSLDGMDRRTGGGSVTWEDGVSSFQWIDLDEGTVRSTLFVTP